MIFGNETSSVPDRLDPRILHMEMDVPPILGIWNNSFFPSLQKSSRHGNYVFTYIFIKSTEKMGLKLCWVLGPKGNLGWEPILCIPQCSLMAQG